MTFIEKIMPNVVNYWSNFEEAIVETLEMVSISMILIIIFGTLLGIVLVVISEGQLYENRILNQIIPKIVNILRAIPFVILLALIMPITRFIVGTAIGVRGAIVPLVVALVPFVSRQVELALLETDKGVIEMARSMGYSRPYIIFRIVLKESRAGILRSIVTSTISLVGFSTMAGVVGGGGIGDFAIKYGYGRMMSDITLVSVVAMLLLVFVIQGIGNLIIKYTLH